MEKMCYDFLTSKEIVPGGWFARQLKIQADGLAGNLDKVWPDVRDSAWIGGKCEGWERVPYWLDGLIPLAYLLKDEDMIARAKKYIDAILTFQREDGWICPCNDDERGNYDTWAVLLITKVLCLYADCSGDERILPVVERCLKQFSSHINVHTLRNWGASRWFEGLIAIHWLYERKPEQWLLALAKKLHAQGFSWEKVFSDGLLDDCTEDWDYCSHIVNIAMMLKSQALWSLLGEADCENFAEKASEYLDKKHGTAAGHYNGDENLSGTSPIQGGELCSVVELMYSYEWLFAVTGDIKWLDRLELLAFNSLPAAISPDMWSHQYDQMANQAACFPMAKQPFRTNNNVAHIFGLEPHFGCCTANFGQGFPKLALSSFMTAENKIVSCVLIPGAVKTNVNGAEVTCELITEYPFRNRLLYRVTVSETTEFTLSVRIPSFAKAAKADGKNIPCGEFYDITRKWSGESETEITLEFEPKLEKRPEGMLCLKRGPLLYSLPIESQWERVEYTADGVERKYPYCDYYIYPKSKWNYAFADDTFEVTENDYTLAFDTKNPPVFISVKVCEIEWGFNNGHCDRLPISAKPLDAPETIRFVPYGCTTLRMTELPFVDRK